MMHCEVHFHSPFNAHTVSSPKQQALLLQFTLTALLELASTHDSPPSSPSISLFPYDWSFESHPLNKIKEHLSLFRYAFVSLPKVIDNIETILLHVAIKEIFDPNQICRDIYEAIAPCVAVCRDSDPFLFFLLQHSRSLENTKLIPSISECLTSSFSIDLMSAVRRIRSYYSSRGFDENDLGLHEMASMTI